MEFTDSGRRAFEQVTRRIAQRGSETFLPPGTPPDASFQRFAITLDNQIVSLATINFRENPEGIDGQTGAQITGIGNIEATQDLANNLRIGALPIELVLISNTQISATLGQQALDQGLIAAGAGLLLVLVFLVAFYRVLGVVAGIALITYAVLLYALVELIPVTLTLPGIAGIILTSASPPTPTSSSSSGSRRRRERGHPSRVPWRRATARPCARSPTPTSWRSGWRSSCSWSPPGASRASR